MNKIAKSIGVTLGVSVILFGIAALVFKVFGFFGTFIVVACAVIGYLVWKKKNPPVA